MADEGDTEITGEVKLISEEVVHKASPAEGGATTLYVCLELTIGDTRMTFAEARRRVETNVPHDTLSLTGFYKHKSFGHMVIVFKHSARSKKYGVWYVCVVYVHTI